MWKILKCVAIATLLTFPGFSQANVAGEKQIRDINIVTEQGEILSVKAPKGVLKMVKFVSHSDTWIILPKDINLHSGRLALNGLQLTFGPFREKSGILGDVTVLNIPIVFSTKKNGHMEYDEGRLEINFYEDGDASVDLWREKYSDYAIEHVKVKQAKNKS